MEKSLDKNKSKSYLRYMGGRFSAIGGRRCRDERRVAMLVFHLISCCTLDQLSFKMNPRGCLRYGIFPHSLRPAGLKRALEVLASSFFPFTTAPSPWIRFSLSHYKKGKAGIAFFPIHALARNCRPRVFCASTRG